MPLEVTEAARIATLNGLPEKSRRRYESIYKTFMEWHTNKKMDSFSENVLLTYFNELANEYKGTSLFTFYSMLRSTLSNYHEVNIEKYSRLRAFLKTHSKTHVPKKAKTFTPEEIKKFLVEAPDNKYLATKVALIMGVTGACRASELYSMQISDIEDLQSAFIVTVPDAKADVVRRFTISGKFFYNICKKYLDLRPSHLLIERSLFFRFYGGKYLSQKIGMNKFSAMAKEIAAFLQLPNSKLYTGHCFRRSSHKLRKGNFMLNLFGD